MSQKVLGAFETVDFPEYGVEKVTAKIDTGAYTGAIHCSSIEERQLNGGQVLVFVPLGGEAIVQKDEYLTRHVKSSNGKRESRYFVATEIIVQGKKYEIFLSLADRSKMKWPVLIGRRFLRKNNFLVDAGRLNGYGDKQKGISS